MKKKYNKPLTKNTTVRNERNFCGSIYETKGVTTKGHEVGETYNFQGNESGTAEGGEFGVSWD